MEEGFCYIYKKDTLLLLISITWDRSSLPKKVTKQFPKSHEETPASESGSCFLLLILRNFSEQHLFNCHEKANPWKSWKSGTKIEFYIFSTIFKIFYIQPE